MDVNEQLRAPLSTVPIALWAADRDGVITPGMSGGAEQRELTAPGAAFIQKPFAPNTLLQKVREVLGTPRRPRERLVRCR